MLTNSSQDDVLNGNHIQVTGSRGDNQKERRGVNVGDLELQNSRAPQLINLLILDDGYCRSIFHVGD